MFTYRVRLELSSCEKDKMLMCEQFNGKRKAVRYSFAGSVQCKMKFHFCSSVMVV